MLHRVENGSTCQGSLPWPTDREPPFLPVLERKAVMPASSLEKRGTLHAPAEQLPVKRLGHCRCISQISRHHCSCVSTRAPSRHDGIMRLYWPDRCHFSSLGAGGIYRIPEERPLHLPGAARRSGDLQRYSSSQAGQTVDSLAFDGAQGPRPGGVLCLACRAISRRWTAERSVSMSAAGSRKGRLP